MSSIAELRSSYENRDAALRAAKSSNRPIIGYVGAAFPRELALAAGALPFAVTPRAGRPTPQADRYIEPVVSVEIRELFQAAIDNELADLDLLVVTRFYAKLYYYLKELYRQGRAPHLPTVHMFDLMQSRRDAVQTYNEQCMHNLLDAIVRVTAHRPTDAELLEAMRSTQRVREVQRRLLDARLGGALTGVDALVAIGAGAFMEPHVYATALEGFLKTLTPGAIRGRPRWLVSSSEPLSHSRLHASLEEAGGVVVAEDDAWGSRSPGVDPQSDVAPLESLRRHVCLEVATGHVWPPDLREAWLEAFVTRPDVDGVVFYIPPSDRQFGWDYPRLKTFAERAGKPTLLLRHDARTEEGRRQIRTAAASLRDAYDTKVASA